MYIYQEKTSRWVVALRVVFTLAVLYSMVFIFKNSLQNAELSTVSSSQMTGLLNRIVTRLGLPAFTEQVVRKLAHMAEFSMLGFFLMLCLRVYTQQFVRHISWPLLIALITATADETIQLYSPGRSSQVGDIWVDFAGTLLGLAAAMFLLVLVRLFILERHGKKERTFQTVEEIQRFEEENRK